MQMIHLLAMPEFKPGDQAPEGYLQWHEWAEVQHKAGLRQSQCGRCGLWRYPQELGPCADEFEARDQRGRVWRCYSAVCLKCVNVRAKRPWPQESSDDQ